MCFRSAKQNLKMNSENLWRAGGEKPEWGFVRSSPKTRRSLYSGVLKFLLHGRKEGEKPQTCVCLFRAERESTGFICTWFLDQSRCFQHAIKGFNIEWYFREAECILLFGFKKSSGQFSMNGNRTRDPDEWLQCFTSKPAVAEVSQLGFFSVCKGEERSGIAQREHSDDW